MQRCDIVIAGAGVAGASLAWALGRRGVAAMVLEREPVAAFHASGRSARTLLESDPNPTIQKLKILGARFLANPPPGFPRLLERRGALGLFTSDSSSTAEAIVELLRRDGIACELLSPRDACGRCPVLDERSFRAALYLPESGFIDVPALMEAFMAQARSSAATFRHGAEIVAVESSGGEELVILADGERIATRTLVNAAGAWAGELGRRAGCAPLVLTPLKRSLGIYEPPEGVVAREWPLVSCDARTLYFRPLGADVMLCPMDAEPSEPCDAQPSPGVFQDALERLRMIAPGLGEMRLKRSWAGLRTFSADGVPVLGRDASRPEVFWLAGQGGCGIETSAVLAEIAADLLVSGTSVRFETSLLATDRFSARNEH